jgi:hypothetical protein
MVLLTGPLSLLHSKDTTRFRNRHAGFLEPHAGSRRHYGSDLVLSPKHWEDWIGAILGFWLLASPNVLEYGERAASQNAFLIGVLLVVIAFVEITVFRPWEEWINVILGAWLLVSPWVLGASLPATTNLVVVGALVLGLALYEIWDERRHLPRAI